jgi:hypothetical protein
MDGRRVYRDFAYGNPMPGEYGKLQGAWYGCTPSGIAGSLRGHDVTEHPDGTITVTPVVLFADGNGKTWYGFLERGVWSERRQPP